jgi:acyl-coenzyme A synthetase/AMP-(fatty) acid ligase
VVAWVVPAAGGDPPQLDDLRLTVAAQLPNFMAPREMRVVTELPRTPLGKVVRSVLRTMPVPP